LTLTNYLKQVWIEMYKKGDKRAVAAPVDEYKKRFPEAVRCLEEDFEGSPSPCDFPKVLKKRISSIHG
jgi:hypothetical protein